MEHGVPKGSIGWSWKHGCRQYNDLYILCSMGYFHISHSSYDGGIVCFPSHSSIALVCLCRFNISSLAKELLWSEVVQ